MSNKWVYTFGNGAAEGKADMRRNEFGRFAGAGGIYRHNRCVQILL